MAAKADLPALKTHPKFIFFTDFDGTITLQDSNDYMTDNLGYGSKKREQGNKDTLEGKTSFRESFKGMMESVTAPYQDCIELLVKNIDLDPGFHDFFRWSQAQNIPIVVLSSGMVPIIRALLHKLVGPDSDTIDIVANDVVAKPGKHINDEDGWDLKFHDDSDFGHDKSLTIRPYANLPDDIRPTMFYAGDGVSDLSAAKETDLLFAKKGKDLVTYCDREHIPFTLFEDWSTISRGVKDIVAGKRTVQEAAREGHEHRKTSLKK